MSYRIQTITIRDIVDYASMDRWKQAPVIPITPERALSQQQNPNARPNDPCLWVAEDGDGSVIGFAGSLPARYARDEGRMGWSSCWWTDPQRGRDAGLPLFMLFLKAWDFRVAFSDMTAHTRDLVDRMDFCHTREEPLLHMHFRLPVKKIIRRLGVPGYLLSPLIPVAALLVNTSQQIRFGLGPERRMDHEDRKSLNEEMEVFIAGNSGTDFSPRNRMEYEWIRCHPWLVSPGEETRPRAKKYPFSSLACSFSSKWLLIREQGVLKSLLHLSLRDGTLKVLSYHGNGAGEAARGLLSFLASHRGINSVILAHPDLVKQCGILRRFSLRTLRKTRYCGISRRLMEGVPEGIHIQLGNGDAIFT